MYMATIHDFGVMLVGNCSEISLKEGDITMEQTTIVAILTRSESGVRT
jgi:hypothetical protein